MAIYGNTNSLGIIPNCAHYYEFDTNKFGCLSCTNGKTGVVTKDGGAGMERDVLGFLESCSAAVTDCAASPVTGSASTLTNY